MYLNQKKLEKQQQQFREKVTEVIKDFVETC